MEKIKVKKLNGFEKSNEELMSAICISIIDYLNKKYDINVHYSFNNSSYTCITKIENGKVEFTIIIGDLDKKSISLSVPETGIVNACSFIKTYNIQSKYMIFAELAFIILHEFGHAKWNVYILKRLYSNQYTFGALDYMFHPLIDSLLPISDNTCDDDAEFNYEFNPFEQIATSFALTHFHEIWNNVIIKIIDGV